MKAARCKKDREVFIFIDANHKIHAGQEEHVPDDVNFVAVSPCTLYLEQKNNKVFAQDTYSLQEGDNWKTPIGKGSVAYSVDKPVVDSKAGPIIVVP